MICPACGTLMIEEDFGGIMVDVCKDGCKGIWFDFKELKDLDENHEGLGKALEEALNSPRKNDENRDPLICPKCEMKMREHKYRNAKKVNVDECYACGGFFLDSGELKQIRDNYMTEDERDAYIQDLISETAQKENMQKRTLRIDGCRALGNLLSKRWPFI